MPDLLDYSEATARLLGPCFICGHKLLSGISVRRFFFLFSNSLSPVLIRVQSVFHPWQNISRSDLPGLPNEPSKILKKAGLSLWPKLWHDLRAARQTELDDQFPSHVVCAWFGNSVKVAAQHC